MCMEQWKKRGPEFERELGGVYGRSGKKKRVGINYIIITAKNKSN